MKNLSLNELTEIMDSMIPLQTWCDARSWQDSCDNIYLIRQKIGVIITIRKLKEIGTLSEDYNPKLVNIDKKSIDNETVSDNIYDFILTMEHLVYDVYTSCGWNVNFYNLEEMINALYMEEFGKDIEDEPINSYVPNLREFWNLKALPFLGELMVGESFPFFEKEIYNIFKNHIQNIYFVHDFSIYQNLKLGAYLSSAGSSNKELDLFIHRLLPFVSMPLYVNITDDKKDGISEKGWYMFNSNMFHEEQNQGECTDACLYSLYALICTGILEKALRIAEELEPDLFKI